MNNFNVNEYIQSLNLEETFADHCRTKEEVDAVLQCKEYIDHHRKDYMHALEHQPKDPTGRQKTLHKLLANAKNQQERDDILAEWDAVYHWHSKVKENKYHIIDYCDEILKDTGMGKRQREKLIPRFTRYLLKTEEDIDERVKNRLFLNKLDRLLSKNNS